MTTTTFVFCVILCFIYIVQDIGMVSSCYAYVDKNRTMHTDIGTFGTALSSSKTTYKRSVNVANDVGKNGTVSLNYTDIDPYCKQKFNNSHCFFEEYEIYSKPGLYKIDWPAKGYITFGNNTYSDRWRWSTAKNRCVKIYYADTECGYGNEENTYSLEQVCNELCTGTYMIVKDKYFQK